MTFVPPCLPSPAPRPPRGANWIHEIKHDGYRMMARRQGERVRLFTRTGVDWGKRYPLVVEAVAKLAASSCLIDGEIAVCDAAGLPVFDLLRSGPQLKTEAILFAFDLLELDGTDLTGAPIEDRKAALAALLRKAPTSVQIVEHVAADAGLVFERACQLGYEGIVSKRLGSRYLSGRSRDWLKFKNPAAPAVKREREEDWGGRRRWR